MGNEGGRVSFCTEGFIYCEEMSMHIMMSYFLWDVQDTIKISQIASPSRYLQNRERDIVLHETKIKNNSREKHDEC